MATFTSGIVDFEKVRSPAGARTWVRDRRVESTAHAGHIVASAFGRHFEVDYTDGGGGGGGDGDEKDGGRAEDLKKAIRVTKKGYSRVLRLEPKPHASLSSVDESKKAMIYGAAFMLHEGD